MYFFTHAKLWAPKLHAGVIKQPTTISVVCHLYKGWIFQMGSSGKVYDKVWSGPYSGI